MDSPTNNSRGPRASAGSRGGSAGSTGAVSAPSMAGRHVVVDGSNLATEGRSLPSLAQLDEAVRAYRVESPDDDVLVVVDASFGYRIDESERQIFEEAEEAGEIVSPPAGAVGRGDGFLLRIADRTGAVVLSNDSFQEFHGDYSWLFNNGRLVGGKPVPGVGWIFTPRTPVRGPKSRVAVRDAVRARRRPAAVAVEEPVAEAIAEARAEAIEPASATAGKARRGRRRSTEPERQPEAVNEPLPFITFIANHPLGSEIIGTVESFTSHGAFVVAGGARCYAPVVGLGDPPPRSAKEVLKRDEIRTFVIQALDPQRRGIELALPGLAHVAGTPTEETVEAEIDIAAQAAPSTSPRRRPTVGVASTESRKAAPTAKRTASGKAATAKKAAGRAKAAPVKAKATAVNKSPGKAVSAAKKAPAAKKTASVKAPSPAKAATAKKAAGRAKSVPVKAAAAPARKAPAKAVAAAHKAAATKKAVSVKAPAPAKAATTKAAGRAKPAPVKAKAALVRKATPAKKAGKARPAPA